MDESAAGSHVRVCAVDDLREDEAVVESVEGTQVALFLLDGDVHALENVCPHQGGPLGEGKVEDGCVFCPWHGWEFDVATGEHVQGLASANAFPVTVDDGDVYVSL
jgi:nitrite reductase/ring-hydroxylating ferredoxin subunit